MGAGEGVGEGVGGSLSAARICTLALTEGGSTVEMRRHMRGAHDGALSSTALRKEEGWVAKEQMSLVKLITASSSCGIRGHSGRRPGGGEGEGEGEGRGG